MFLLSSIVPSGGGSKYKFFLAFSRTLDLEQLVCQSTVVPRRCFVMKDFLTYLSTAPVLTLVSASFAASLLIEVNRFFPDSLIFAF
jgi:photosystem I subunit 9